MLDFLFNIIMFIALFYYYTKCRSLKQSLEDSLEKQRQLRRDLDLLLLETQKYRYESSEKFKKMVNHHAGVLLDGNSSIKSIIHKKIDRFSDEEDSHSILVSGSDSNSISEISTNINSSDKYSGNGGGFSGSGAGSSWSNDYSSSSSSSGSSSSDSGSSGGEY